MKCILMNKDTEVLVGDYESNTRGFKSIIEVKNINYAPHLV